MPPTRTSFCCARCRKRVTPPSVRFLGRRVYLGAIVVLACVLRQWPTPWRVARLGEVLGVSRDTLARWHRWWRDVFVRTAFWKAAVAALRKTRKSGLVDPNILWIGRGRLSDSWWLVLVPVSGSRGKLPSPSSHRTGLVGLTSGSSGRRGRRKVLRPVRRQHRCPQLFQRECHLRRSDDAVHVTVLELQ